MTSLDLPQGTRVRMTKEAIRNFSMAKVHTGGIVRKSPAHVMRYKPEQSGVLIQVQRDGQTRSETWHHTFWEEGAESKLWCAMCGKWTDHQSGKCPELHPKEATYRVPVDKFPPQKLPK